MEGVEAMECRPIPTWLMLIALLGCASPGRAQDCFMVDPERGEMGTRPAIRGACSNSGESVSCSFADEDRWTCSAPNGSYTDLDVRFASVVALACGCTVAPGEVFEQF
jgi:hypothetical protein